MSNLVVCIDLFLSFYIYWGIFSYFWDVYFILSEKFRKHYTCVIAVCSCNIKLNLTFCLLIISFIKIKLNVVESLFFLALLVSWIFFKGYCDCLWNGPFSYRQLIVFSWSHDQYDILWILNNTLIHMMHRTCSADEILNCSFLCHNSKSVGIRRDRKSVV